MRKLKMGLITLAASAAVLAPVAGSATASTQSASTTSTAGCIGLLTCFDILNGNDVTVVKDVDVSTGGILCGVSVVELNLLSIGDFTDCSNNSHPEYSKIKRKW